MRRVWHATGVPASHPPLLDARHRDMVSHMGETIEFSDHDGNPAKGYLATPSGGVGPGVIVIQEWWGVVDQIETTCDRFADAGFVALAPDLYDGVVVPLHEPDEAAKEMMALEMDVAARDLSGAVDALLERSTGETVGVIGFCMGGGLALVLGTLRPDAVAAVIPCYGVHPWEASKPDYTKTTAATQIHCAALDGSFTPDDAEQLAGTLSALGHEVELHVYPGCDHAFFNEDRPEVFDEAAAALLFERSAAFLRDHLT